MDVGVCARSLLQGPTLCEAPKPQPERLPRLGLWFARPRKGATEGRPGFPMITRRTRNARAIWSIAGRSKALQGPAPPFRLAGVDIAHLFRRVGKVERAMARSTAEMAARCSRSLSTCRCRSDSSMWNRVLAPARWPQPRYRLSAGSWGSHLKGCASNMATPSAPVTS